ncbi:WD repeat-containing protein 43 [Hordeum vulgare]|nr:WD repeat-containing protein 43 [Hordeum vulgare]
MGIIIYPLEFAIVGQEDTQSWCWFLHQLKICLGGETGQFGPYTIMSDRQKGLLNAVNQVFPNSHQRFCLRHLYANFQNAGFRGEDLKKYMDNASYAYNEHKFELAMDHMKKESEKAWKWLSEIPKKNWARHAFDTNCKTDLVVNNLSEVFNKYILDVRKKSIRTMCDGIKDKMMVRWHRNRESGKAARWGITPHYSEKLEAEKERARFCKPIQASVNLWQAPARNAPAHATTAPAPAGRGTGATAGRGDAAGRGAGRGDGATAGRGAGAGRGVGAGAGRGAGRGGFSAPRWAASASTSGNTGWASYFNASGNR